MKVRDGSSYFLGEQGMTQSREGLEWQTYNSLDPPESSITAFTD